MEELNLYLLYHTGSAGVSGPQWANSVAAAHKLHRKSGMSLISGGSATD